MNNKINEGDGKFLKSRVSGKGMHVCVFSSRFWNWYVCNNNNNIFLLDTEHIKDPIRVMQYSKAIFWRDSQWSQGQLFADRSVFDNDISLVAWQMQIWMSQDRTIAKKMSLEFWRKCGFGEEIFPWEAPVFRTVQFSWDSLMTDGWLN